MRAFLLATLACLFLVAPPAAQLLCLGVAFVMSAGLVDMLRVGTPIAQRRSMLNARFRAHAAAITRARRGDVRPQAISRSCFR